MCPNVCAVCVLGAVCAECERGTLLKVRFGEMILTVLYVLLAKTVTHMIATCMAKHPCGICDLLHAHSAVHKLCPSAHFSSSQKLQAASTSTTTQHSSLWAVKIAWFRFSTCAPTRSLCGGRCVRSKPLHCSLYHVLRCHAELFVCGPQLVHQ